MYKPSFGVTILVIGIILLTGCSRSTTSFPIVTNTPTPIVPTPMTAEAIPTATPVLPESITATTSHPTSTPTPMPTGNIHSPPQHQCTVIANALNLREGPSTQFNIIDQMPEGTLFEAKERLEDATWIFGTSPTANGWASAKYFGCTFDLRELPVSVTILPTYTPLPTDTPAPTDTPIIPPTVTGTPTNTPTPIVPPTITPGLPPRAGSLDIPQTWTVDLDEGVIGAGGKADIWFEAVTAVERYVTPQNGAIIAIVGTTSVGQSGCATAPLSKTQINIDSLSEGTYVCVRTNSGRYSQFRVNAPVGPSPGILSISYTTW